MRKINRSSWHALKYRIVHSQLVECLRSDLESMPSRDVTLLILDKSSAVRTHVSCMAAFYFRSSREINITRFLHEAPLFTSHVLSGDNLYYFSLAASIDTAHSTLFWWHMVIGGSIDLSHTFLKWNLGCLFLLTQLICHYFGDVLVARCVDLSSLLKWY